MLNRAFSDQIKELAKVLGFDDCGIADPALEADDGFDFWLSQGFHNGLVWLERSRDKRQQIVTVLPGVQSVIVVAANYYHPGGTDSPRSAKIARYAWRRDYHRVMKPRLQSLADWIRESQPGTECYCCVDTGPVRERPWAYRAGLGWIGKNSLLLHPVHGSWVHLGVILTTAKLVADRPLPDGCGSCTRCIDHCPTGAITAQRSIDTNKCIACQTIERKTAPLSLPLHGWVFGCDLCQEICPINHKLQHEGSCLEEARSSFSELTHASVASLSEAAFQDHFAGTPIMRAGYDCLRANALQALENPLFPESKQG